jgi:hypothetical protein
LRRQPFLLDSCDVVKHHVLDVKHRIFYFVESIVAAAGLAMAFGIFTGLIISLNLAITSSVPRIVALPICALLVWKSKVTSYGLEKTVIVLFYAENHLSESLDGQ